MKAEDWGGTSGLRRTMKLSTTAILGFLAVSTASTEGWHHLLGVSAFGILGIQTTRARV